MTQRVLIVDDDRQLRLVLKHILRREGYDVAEAGDGFAALQSAKAARVNGGFDLALVDIIMPNKEGIETIMEIRRDHPDMRIIAMSGGRRLNYAVNGESGRDPLQLAQECGANFAIAKPFEPADIRSLVRMCFS